MTQEPKVSSNVERVARAIDEDLCQRHYGIPSDWDNLPDYQRGELILAARAAIASLSTNDTGEEPSAQPKPMTDPDGRVERVIRDLAKSLYAHHVIKYDPAAEERCIVAAIAALSTDDAEQKDGE